MSFKLLIVDDEPIIREGLKSTIPWDSYGMEVVDVVEDGEAALEWMENHNAIDLVLTDVRMPNMDGLQLATHLTSRFPNVKIVMISGYDEFKYAQQAIQLGVEDYLLKPVDVDELVQVVEKVAKEMEVEREKSAKHQQLNISHAMYHQVFDHTSILPDNLKAFQSLCIYPFLTMVKEYVRVTEQFSDQKVDRWQQEWMKQIHKQFLQHEWSVFSIFTTENVLLSCVVDPEQNLQPSKIIDIVKETNMPFDIVLNSTQIPLGKLHQVYPKLVRNIERIAVEEQVVTATEKILQVSPDLEWLKEQEDTFNEFIFQSNSKGLEEQTEKVFQHFLAEQYTLQQAKHVLETIIQHVVSRFDPLFDRDILVNDFTFTREVNVHVYNSFRLLEEVFIQDLMKVVHLLQRKDNKLWMIERAEHYIHSYYASDIKAHEVADVIHLSPNYFSSLFKQKTGKNFNEYLNELRVEKAKVLLEETPLKINEIADTVGFHEYKYFVDVFKRFVQMTPTKYRSWMSSKKKVN
ncbi:response regulator [Radiobacillus kanasensis]|uniref:response regulator transcription factor n=1 Tax=Radiobacillus kanasensis TaxID=2844358 RepID=UPI001E65C61C|nr:response regulator [Radiobacillus kanasensis]UFU00785.1 response regulator [Radiobacillus kanasensis]